MGNLLCELDAELSEVLPRGCQVVADDGDVLLDVEDYRGDIRTLIANVFHVLPLHLHGEEKTSKKTV